MSYGFFRSFALLLLFVTGNCCALDHDNGWEFTLLFPMVWAPDISGEIDVDGQVIEVDTPFSDILDSLSFGYMAEFYARKNRWVYGLKLNYLETEEESITEGFDFPGSGIPIAPSHSIVSERVLGFTDLVVGYQLTDSTRLYTGVRGLFTKIDLKIKPLGQGIIAIDKKINLADETLYDWLLGGDYTYRINPRWSLILGGDVAIAGDNDKGLMGNVVLTYRISQLNNIWMGYRYMRFKDIMTADGVVIKTDFTQQGPMIGWAFTF
jgi:hypothetical protein